MGRCRLDVPASLAATDVDRTGQTLGRHGDRVPAYAGAAVLDFHRRENVGAQRLLRVGNLDRHVEQRDETLPHKDLLLRVAEEKGDATGGLRAHGGDAGGWGRVRGPGARRAGT